MARARRRPPAGLEGVFTRCGTIPKEKASPLVTNQQLCIVVGLPMLFNAALYGLLIAYIEARLSRWEAKLDAAATLDRRGWKQRSTPD